MTKTLTNSAATDCLLVVDEQEANIHVLRAVTALLAPRRKNKELISIEADDPKFDVDKTRALLETAHAAHVEVVEEDVS